MQEYKKGKIFWKLKRKKRNCKENKYKWKEKEEKEEIYKRKIVMVKSFQMSYLF